MRVQRSGLHCLIPPYILEALSESKDARVRKLAVDAIEASATARAVRTTLSTMPQMAAVPSPKGTKHRLIYDLRGRDFSALPGKLVRREGQGRTKDPAVNDFVQHESLEGRSALRMGQRLIHGHPRIHFAMKFSGQ